MTNSSNLSVREISKITGLSTATISRALNNSSKVSRKTKEQISAILMENGYENPFKKNATIGLIAASTISEYYVSLISEITKYLDLMNMHVLTYFIDEQKVMSKDALQLMSNLEVDGLIVISFQDNRFDLSALRDIPTIWIDNNYSDNPDFYTVTSDHYVAGKMAGDMLIEAGCSKPLMIVGQGDSPRTLKRIEGFTQSFKDKNIPFDSSRIIHTPIINDPFDEGREAVMYNYTKGIGVDGIFAINDLRAVGAYTAAKELGLKIPEDIKIIGFDGISLTNNKIFEITSIQQNTQLIARSACEMLNNLINGIPVPVKNVTIPVKLNRGKTL